MAVDFSNVKEVTIPQGNVKEIKINGSTVWEKKSGLNGSITFQSINGSYYVNNLIIVGKANFSATSTWKYKYYASFSMVSPTYINYFKDSGNNVSIFSSSSSIINLTSGLTTYSTSASTKSNLLNNTFSASYISKSLSGNGKIRIYGVLCEANQNVTQAAILCLSNKQNESIYYNQYVEYIIQNGEIISSGIYSNTTPNIIGSSQSSSTNERYIAIAPNRIEVINE